MKNFAFAFLALGLAIAGCRHPAEPGPGESVADYLPVKPGSSWEYLYNGPYRYEASLVAGGDTLIGGRKYHTIVHNGWSDVWRLYRFSGDEAYQRDQDGREELILKMAPAGATWSSTLNYDNGFRHILTSHVAAKDTTVEVYEKTFTRVICVASRVQQINGDGSSAGDFTLVRYYAKGIGLVKETRADWEENYFGLKEYSVK